MKSLSDISIEKSRSGVYKDTAENRRLHRVGQRYGQPKKEESSNGASSLPTKEDLEFSKDGSSIVVENVQTGNTVIFYSKRGGKWFSEHAMVSGGISTNPDRMIRTLQGYNRKTYSIKPDLRVSDIEDLKRDKKVAQDALKQLRKKKYLFDSDGDEERYNRGVQSLQNKIDTLGQEITRRKAESKKSSEVKIDGKTFRVENGKIVASMYDTQSRIRKIMKFAEENGYKIAWEESKTVQKPDLKHSDSSEGKSEVKYEDYEGEDEDGELVTFTYDKDKFDRYKLYIWLKAARLKRGTDPNLSKLGYLKNSGDLNKKAIEKFFELKKEFGDGRRYDFKEKNQEDEMKGKPEQKPVEQSSSDEGVFTRVSFQDIPNAHKVNLKKYLSAKRKTAVDEAWSKAKFDSVSREKAGVFQEGYNKLREQFNNNFDSMSKAERAELLYKILKMKNAIERK